MTSRPGGRTRLSDRGSVTAETAILAVPLMVLLILFLVFCGRAASAVIDVESAAASAARAAADAPTPKAADTAAQSAVDATTTGSSWRCTAATNTAQFHRGGQVSVTVTCVVPMSDLGLPVGATRTVHGQATEPIATYKADS
jgi:Flp pilus assembly protein TadG